MFLLVFATISGLLHFYLFRHLSSAWPDLDQGFAGLLVGLWLLPFLMGYFRSRKMDNPTRVCALVGFTWLGVLFLAAVFLGLLDLYSTIGPLLAWPPPPPRTTVGIAALLTGLSVLYGTSEARRPRLKTIRLPIRQTNHSIRSFRIVQLSDLHLGYVAPADRLRELVARVNALQPELVVSTGDLFDSDFDRMAPLCEILNGLKAPFGKFAVSGNHEVYEDLGRGLSLTRRAGFTVLRGESVEVRPGLHLAGVDDAEGIPAGTAGDHEDRALAGIPDGAFTVLLKHRPSVLKASVGRFHLQLSGHTHGGQIFPFNLLTRLVYHHRPGLNRLSPDSWLYLSRGTGTWGPQFRIFAPPEITLFELTG